MVKRWSSGGKPFQSRAAVIAKARPPTRRVGGMFIFDVDAERSCRRESMFASSRAGCGTHVDHSIHKNKVWHWCRDKKRKKDGRKLHTNIVRNVASSNLCVMFDPLLSSL